MKASEYRAAVLRTYLDEAAAYGDATRHGVRMLEISPMQFREDWEAFLMVATTARKAWRAAVAFTRLWEGSE